MKKLIVLYGPIDWSTVERSGCSTYHYDVASSSEIMKICSTLTVHWSFKLRCSTYENMCDIHWSSVI